MAKKFLLIGPPGGGKTTMLSAYDGALKSHVATQTTEEVKTGWFGLGLMGGDSLLEYGGNTKNIEESIAKLKTGNHIVLFVFDGEDFLKQVRNPSQGGMVYSRWLRYNAGFKINRPHFVATHADMVPDLKNAILQGIKDANDEYKSIVGQERYESSLFEEPFFHCINATKENEVKELIKKIKQ